MQAKRIQVNEANNGVGAQIAVNLNVLTTPREMVNFHNIWVSVSVEPQNTDANAQGTWVLLTLRENQVFGLFNDSNVNNEQANAYTIACGVWSASNQTPYNMTTQIKTSRNLNPGDALVLISTVTGITAGLASNRVMLCAHSVRA